MLHSNKSSNAIVESREVKLIMVKVLVLSLGSSWSFSQDFTITPLIIGNGPTFIYLSFQYYLVDVLRKRKWPSQCWCLRRWACSLKADAQVFPQSWQGMAVLGFGTLVFLASLLSSNLLRWFISKHSLPSLVAVFHAVRFRASTCHLSPGMVYTLRVVLRPSASPPTSWEFRMEQLLWQPGDVHSHDMFQPT